MKETNIYVDQSISVLSYDTTCRIQHPLVSDRHCQRLAKSIPQICRLERLSFYRCPRIGSQGIQTVLEAVSHKYNKENALELEISSVSLHDDGLRSLAEWLYPNKKDKEITQRPVLTLKSLELEDIGYVQPQTWNFFLPRVLLNTTNCHLQTLDLTHNYLTTESISVLANLLESNNSLSNLILSENPMIGDTGTKLLCKAMERNKTLSVLSLAVCSITSKGIQLLADCVESHNTQLTRIYLFGNPYNQTNSKEKSKLSYWLDLNAHGRSSMMLHVEDCIAPSIIPHVLAVPSKQNRSDLLYGLLRQLPHLWTPATNITTATLRTTED